MSLEKSLFELDYWYVDISSKKIKIPGTVILENKNKKEFYELNDLEINELSKALVYSANKIKDGYFKEKEESYNLIITNNPYKEKRYFVPFRKPSTYKVPSDGCLFCYLAKLGKPSRYNYPDDIYSYVLDYFDDFFVILNVFPYSFGNVMIIPNEHKRSISEIGYENTYKMLKIAKEWLLKINNLFYKKGKPIYVVYANVGQNSGRSIEHFHLQITIFSKKQFENFNFDWIFNDRTAFLDKMFEVIMQNKNDFKILYGMNFLESRKSYVKAILVPRYRQIAGLELAELYPCNEEIEETVKKFKGN
ncbi:MAG: HIT domain-containing protein [Candidatus Aenigmatarchaeota archaeon]